MWENPTAGLDFMMEPAIPRASTPRFRRLRVGGADREHRTRVIRKGCIVRDTRWTAEEKR